MSAETTRPETGRPFMAGGLLQLAVWVAFLGVLVALGNGRFNDMNGRFDRIEARINKRLDGIDTRLERIETRFDRIEQLLLKENATP